MPLRAVTVIHAHKGAMVTLTVSAPRMKTTGNHRRIPSSCVSPAHRQVKVISPIQMHFVLGSGLEHGLAKLKNAGVTLNSCFSQPRARGTVTLRDSDPSTPPVIDPNYWGDPYDREMSLRGFKLAREIMAQDAFRPFILCERYPGPDVRSDADIAAYARKVGKTDYPSGRHLQDGERRHGGGGPHTESARP